MGIEQTLRRGRQLAGRDFHGTSIDQAGLRLNDQTLTLEASDASFARLYDHLSEYFEQNQQALLNFRRSRGQQGRPIRIPSDVGFSEVLRVQNGVPFVFYVPSKDGSLNPRRRGIENPTQLCMHSFGLNWSQGRLRRDVNSREPAVDRFSYNPYRFLNGIRDMNTPVSEGGRVVAVHHFVSRRGDICNMAPWDNQACHAAGYAQRRSIAIELETHMIRDTTQPRSRQLSYTVAVPPYTQEQILACAFLVKKMLAWTPDERILRFLGVTEEGRNLVRQQVPGMFTHHTVATRSKVDAFCEFEFPVDWKIGDPYPDYPTFSTLPRTWDRRIERFHADKPRGTYISHWRDLFAKVRRIRNFNLQTEVFDTSFGQRFLELSPAQVGGSGPSAAAQQAARVRTVGVIRSQDMTATSRAGLYQAARGVSTTAARTWDDARSRTERVAGRATRVPIITGGTCFNYTTGLWENTTTTNQPAPNARTGSGDAVRTTTVTDEPTDVPGD